MKNKTDVCAADLETCQYSIYERDFQLELLAQKLSENDWLDMMANTFNIHPVNKNAEYKIFCPSCSNPDSMIINLRGPKNIISFSCSCNIQKRGNTFVDLVQLFNSVSRSTIIKTIKTYIAAKEMRTRQRPKVPANTAVFKIS